MGFDLYVVVEIEVEVDLPGGVAGGVVLDAVDGALVAGEDSAGDAHGLADAYGWPVGEGDADVGREGADGALEGSHAVGGDDGVVGPGGAGGAVDPAEGVSPHDAVEGGDVAGACVEEEDAGEEREGDVAQPVSRAACHAVGGGVEVDVVEEWERGAEVGEGVPEGVGCETAACFHDIPA